MRATTSLNREIWLGTKSPRVDHKVASSEVASQTRLETMCQRSPVP